MSTRLFVGKRVLTPLGEAEVVSVRNAHDVVPPHGKPVRGTAWVTVELERGGRRVYRQREVHELPP